MINLETKEKIIKAEFLNGNEIYFIKVNERNKCVIVGTFGFEQAFLLDYQGNKLNDNPVHPFSLTCSIERQYSLYIIKILWKFLKQLIFIQD